MICVKQFRSLTIVSKSAAPMRGRRLDNKTGVAYNYKQLMAMFIATPISNSALFYTLLYFLQLKLQALVYTTTTAVTFSCCGQPLSETRGNDKHSRKLSSWAQLVLVRGWHCLKGVIDT